MGFLSSVHAFYHTAMAIPPVQMGVGGAVSAALVDFAAFKKFQSWHDAAVYDWGTASFRWFSGFAIAALTSLGIGAL